MVMQPFDTSDDTAILARFDRVKIGALALFSLALAIAPNLPGFGKGLRYTAFLYTPIGAPIRWSATIVLAVTGLIAMALFVEATVTSGTAIWLKGGELHWRALGHKRVSLMAIRSVSVKPRLISLERNDGRKPIEFSTVALKSSDAPEPLSSRLRGLIN